MGVRRERGRVKGKEKKEGRRVEGRGKGREGDRGKQSDITLLLMAEGASGHPARHGGRRCSPHHRYTGL